MRETPYGRLKRLLLLPCKGAALFGGVFMIAGVLVVVASVTGGILGKPLLGDSEIVDRFIGIAIFCFLPYCHLMGGNIVIDFFAKPFPQAVQDGLDVVMNLLFAALAAFISWRLMAGGITTFERGRQSMFLQLPEWPVYLVASIVTVLWVLVILFAAYEAFLRMTGKLEAARGGTDFG